MERGLSDPKNIRLLNPIITEGNKNRLPSEDLYNRGYVGDVVRVFFKDSYTNVIIEGMLSDTRTISLEGNCYTQEWDGKRWGKLIFQEG